MVTIPRRSNYTDVNPEKTSGRAATPMQTLSFPLSEQPMFQTKIRFIEYSRLKPILDKTETTTAMLTLPMPMSLKDISEIKVGSTDLGAWGNMDLSYLNKAVGINSLEPLKLAWEAGKSTAVDALKTMSTTFKVSALKGLALSPVMSDNSKRGLSLLAGVVQNPHTNTMFEGVGLKRHALAWRFSPRSQQESDALNEIIRLIKMRTHPAESFAGYALDYPDLIEVEFTGGAQQYLPLIRRSMISTFDVSMSGGDGVAFFKTGAPVFYDVTLSFQEINIVTRDVLEEAYGNGPA